MRHEFTRDALEFGKNISGLLGGNFPLLRLGVAQQTRFHLFQTLGHVGAHRKRFCEFHKGPPKNPTKSAIVRPSPSGLAPNRSRGAPARLIQ